MLCKWEDSQSRVWKLQEHERQQGYSGSSCSGNGRVSDEGAITAAVGGRRMQLGSSHNHDAIHINLRDAPILFCEEVVNRLTMAQSSIS